MEELDKIFETKTSFSLQIEEERLRLGASYIDTIVDYCQRKNLDIEAVASVLSPAIKEKIRGEAEQLNLLERTARLPI